MSETASKQRIDEKLNYIFNKEKDKKEQELVGQKETEKEKTKEKRQKELGTN